MPDVNDDPREVLALLNSLGFVGITAPQLKAFMKDLKMYRKMKEREKQQHKEEIRKKILSKQQSVIREICKENLKESNIRTNDSSSSNLIDYQCDDSMVSVNIECFVNRQKTQLYRCDKDQSDIENLKEITNVLQSKHERRCNCRCMTKSVQRSGNNKSHSNVKEIKKEIDIDIPSNNIKTIRDRSSDKYVHTEKAKESKYMNKDAKKLTTSKRPMSAVNSSEEDRKPKSESRLDSVKGNAHSQSVPSTRTSSACRHKSFIRPWRLQPDTQRSAESKKSDPVTLYQKYQEEWKKISFPGHAKHADVRWAIREKMLGADPHPPPVPRKTVSAPSLKRK